jgi:hypothetical protein
LFALRFLVVLTFPLGCSVTEECSCPPSAGVRIEMSQALADSLKGITFEPPNCGLVQDLPTTCTPRCAAHVIARDAGACTVVLTFDGGRVDRLNTIWDATGGGCCGVAYVPRESTLVVQD